MTRSSLSELFQKHAARNAPSESGALDADSIVRLAAGEHLGDRHEAALASLASSSRDTALFRLARDTAPHSELLAQGMNAMRKSSAPARSALRRPVTRIALALAAGLAAVAVMVTLRVGDLPTESAPNAVSAPVATMGDKLLAVSFETPSTLPETPAGQDAHPREDPIFRGSFGT